MAPFGSRSHKYSKRSTEQKDTSMPLEPPCRAHIDEIAAGACPESLLPDGDPAIRGEDASPWRLPEGPFRYEPD